MIKPAESSVNGPPNAICRTCHGPFRRLRYNEKDCPTCRGPKARVLAYARRQLDMLEAPAVDVDTSQAAADSIRPGANQLRQRVYDALKETGGLTCEELCELLKLEGNTVRPRLWELEHEKRVEKSEAKRETRSGRLARVYVVMEE